MKQGRHKRQLMAILNATDDSFYEKSRKASFEEALAWGQQMIVDGADILDIGGESSRPFSDAVSLDLEYKRVIPLVKAFRTFPITLSVDTKKWQIAHEALSCGATIINDISGLQDPSMRSVVKEHGCQCVIMHMQGCPATMQTNPHYPNGVIQDLIDWFARRLDLLSQSGIDLNCLILDPGIGFGKTVQDTLQILKNLHRFTVFGLPLMVGLSRKSFMGKILKKNAQDLLSTTLALNTMSLLAGVSIIRVHDVVAHRDVLDLLQAIDAHVG